MPDTISTDRAQEIASSWGSYMHAGDPGAVLYGIPDSGVLDSECQRFLLCEQVGLRLADVRDALANGTASRMDWSADDESDLLALLAWIVAAPVAPLNPA